MAPLALAAVVCAAGRDGNAPLTTAVNTKACVSSALALWPCQPYADCGSFVEHPLTHRERRYSRCTTPSCTSSAEEGTAGVDHVGLSLTLVTDLDGVIREASENAHSFLGVSARSAVGRNLLLFFAEDRLAVLASIRRLTQLERVEGSARLKPRDRRPIPVRFCIVAAGPRGVSELVRWDILRVPPTGAINSKESASSL